MSSYAPMLVWIGADQSRQAGDLVDLLAVDELPEFEAHVFIGGILFPVVGFREFDASKVDRFLMDRTLVGTSTGPSFLCSSSIRIKQSTGCSKRR